MKSLIAKLEAATGADQELDVRLHMALNPDAAILFGAGTANAIWGCYRDVVIEDWPSFSDLARIVRAPRYTSSIDAALTLVQEGFAWTLSTHGVTDFEFFASVCFPDEESDGTPTVHPCAAIALCIAALRARDGGRG